MKNKVTAVVTSYNRFDLLKQTIDSLQSYFDGEIIIIEDSVNAEMKALVEAEYPQHTLVFNEENLGLIKNIDKAYSMVKTPYVFHTEDDYFFHSRGFIEESLAILENDPMLNMVWIKGIDEFGRQKFPISEEQFMVGDIPYHIVLPRNTWTGFCFQCGLRSMKAYHEVAPYDNLICEWVDENGHTRGGWHITNREKACDAAYHKLGYRSAILTKRYAEHLGYLRSTYGLRNR